MSVAAMHATPAVDDDVGTIGADDAHHFSENCIAPDFFRFLGRFRESKIWRTSKKEFYAVASRGGEQFLRADQSQLRRLLRSEIVLSAFTASESEQRDVGVESAGEIGEQGGGFIVRMRSDIENARGDACAV